MSSRYGLQALTLGARSYLLGVVRAAPVRAIEKPRPGMGVQTSGTWLGQVLGAASPQRGGCS